ncbi:uncharacterized protein P174DRAFT_435780 [Aspergillus novofumigatus IBT 16806]|uniref:Uncharacterized protein n=1 Tax=Aspergillus novofumigatus (strain IBT 16806) TaxID=1392255 RepID=A0A2I1BUV6_ASPN1|nr:uncharacterized protein P174DRAFT_435780 [Aspergillus novofumigatus IBT 16806]PKX89081.1 hypothetical protein P174DRAFT_435780 [Aspergillus novofumigatus IBT 16806]
MDVLKFYLEYIWKALGQPGALSVPVGQTLPALAVVRGPGDKKVTPSSNRTTCQIMINNITYYSFCRKPYHMDSECFNKNPRLKDQKKDGKGQRSKLSNPQTSTRKPLKRHPPTDNEDDDIAGPRDPKWPTLMATKVSREDINKAFRKDVKGNFALFNHIPSIMATKTFPIHNAWIVNSGCARHISTMDPG